jgi:hypothetical protein
MPSDYLVLYKAAGPINDLRETIPIHAQCAENKYEAIARSLMVIATDHSRGATALSTLNCIYDLPDNMQDLATLINDNYNCAMQVVIDFYQTEEFKQRVWYDFIMDNFNGLCEILTASQAVSGRTVTVMFICETTKEVVLQNEILKLRGELRDKPQPKYVVNMQ